MSGRACTWASAFACDPDKRNCSKAVPNSNIPKKKEQEIDVCSFRSTRYKSTHQLYQITIGPPVCALLKSGSSSSSSSSITTKIHSNNFIFTRALIRFNYRSDDEQGASKLLPRQDQRTSHPVASRRTDWHAGPTESFPTCQWLKHAAWRVVGGGVAVAEEGVTTALLRCGGGNARPADGCQGVGQGVAHSHSLHRDPSPRAAAAGPMGHGPTPGATPLWACFIVVFSPG
jgi:hypothetical protein